MTQVFLPGFVLDNGIYAGTVTAEFSISDGATLSYAVDPDPAKMNDFGIHAAIVTTTESASLTLNNDETHFFNVHLSTGVTVPVVTFWDAAQDVDQVFILDTSYPNPTTAADYLTLDGLITGATPIMSGPFAIGAAIDITALVTATTQANDTFDGDADNDHFDGGPGDDSLDGAGGNDTLNGDAGDDYINGSEGDDTLNGGADNDVLAPGAGTDTIDGGSGTDQLSYRLDAVAYGTGVTVLFTGVGAGTVTDFAGDTDTFTGIEKLTGTDFADSLTGAHGADQLYGRDGVDVLDGGDNDDGLWGGDGDDTLLGRSGADRLSGGAGADILNGNRGFDFADYSDSSAPVTIDLRTGTGTGGDAEGDTLFNIEGIEGSADADTLLGYTADEILNGHDGGDILRGKAGDDTLFGGNGADRVNGGAGRDTLFGEFGADILQGRGGDDVLWGGGGRDILKGHAGDDRLNGEDGDDHIEGKGGDDTLTGGTGADTFVFEKNRFGNDVITDFEDDVDTIELVESLWGGGLTAAQVLATYATQDGADVDFDFGTATLTVQNTTVAVLENDLSFV